MIINEVTRLDILQRSKTKTKLNRYSRRMGVQNVSILRIGILELLYLDQPDLDVYFDINDNYRVSIRFMNFMDGVRSLFQQFSDKITKEGGINVSKTMREIVEVSLDNALTYDDIRVGCSCPDFAYRFAYVAYINDYNFETPPQTIPALVRNPNNNGSACKHVIKVLSRPSLWKAKVVTGVMNVIKRNPDILVS